ncbi:hypothetical protein GQ589_01110 [Gilliamella sp. Pas-s27]|nr:hypothetical protein [Gilliamella sp. Pas-s27]
MVLVAGGYPGKYNTKDVILGLPAESTEDCKIFHAGTSLEKGRVHTNGGRVLCITALGNTVLEAQQRAYQQAKDIYWHGCFYQHDIGYRAIEREQNGHKS